MNPSLEPGGKGSPLIYSYLRKYQENPGSRVFAPLAEAYRKAGLVDEAIEIAREGLNLHPKFVGGRVALSRALFDKQKYVEVIEELRDVIRDNPDNLVAQRLMAESSLMLGRIPDALNAYKMLLYFNPTDSETAKIVFELEAQAYEGKLLTLRTDEEGAPARTTGSTTLDRATRAAWVRRIELLQNLLQRVERYRLEVAESDSLTRR